jgi:uridine kinase
MFITGIAGGSAAGKSTFARILTETVATRLPDSSVQVISTDQHWRDRSGPPRFTSPSSGEEVFNHNHPDALNTESLFAALDAAEADIILLEGLMILHLPAVRERINLKLFLELDADERALRRLLRDMQGGRTISDPQKIATYYRESARVGHAAYVEPSRVHADIILRGDSDFARTADMVAAIIEDHYKATQAGNKREREQ